MSDKNKEKAKYVGEMILIKMKSLEKKLDLLDKKQLVHENIKHMELFERFDNRCIDIEIVLGVNSKSEAARTKPFKERIEQLEQNFNKRKVERIAEEQRGLRFRIEKLEDVIKNIGPRIKEVDEE